MNQLVNKTKVFVVLFVVFISGHVIAQDDRSQVPEFMQKTYFEVNLGAINYNFTQASMEPGYTLNSVSIPPVAVRLVLFGYDFNKYLSAQITYMRPVLWVRYNYSIDSNLDQAHSRSVWMNVGGLTIKPRIPIGKHFSVYGEGGLGIITRHGFEDPQGNPVVTDANYPTFLFGAGLKYHINDKWALQLSSNYSPENKSVKQPATSFIGTGFSYNFRAFTPERLSKAAELGYIHPKQWLQIGYTSNILGYAVNDFVSRDPVPIFWGGRAEVRQGISLNYQRNVFHGPKVFALDWGVNASYWQSNENKEDFFTFSIFPVFRLNFLHTKPFDAYFYYSVAGPSYISKKIIDGEDTGEHFTFQDTMGAGVFFGKERNYNAEIKIGHYSNGNIYPSNDAVKVPLSLNIGYAF